MTVSPGLSPELNAAATPVSTLPPGRGGRREFLLALVIGITVGGIAAGVWTWNWYVARDFRQRCELARKAGDWQVLQSVAQEWADWHPQSGSAWLFVAEAAEQLDQWPQTAQALGHVPEDDPRAVLAYSEKANIEWTALNQPLTAIETSRQVLRLEPRAVEIRARLISFYAINLQRAPMIREIREAMSLGVEPREAYPYLILADKLPFTNGVDMNSRWLASAPDEMRFKIGLAVHTAMSINSNVDISRTEEGLAMQRQAEQQLHWFLDGAPHDPVLLTFVMDRAYETGDVDAMGRLLQQVHEPNVDDHMIWVFRAWYHLHRDQPDDAEIAIREALRLHALSPAARHEYAALLRRTGRTGVVEQQELAARGRELRTQLLHSPNASDVTGQLLQDIADYARDCGDRQVAESLARRLQPPALTSGPRNP